MYHRLEKIATNRRLDKVKFATFCGQNSDRFGIHSDGGVHTWYVDELVKAYRESLKEA